MPINKKVLTAGLAVFGILAGTAAASAAPAVATSNVNVRSGPSTGYPVVDSLRRGERVEVEQCRGSWCYVIKPGPDGWVSSSYLSSGRPGWDNGYDNGWDRPPPPPPIYDRPPPRPPHWNPRPPRPPYWDTRPPRPQPVPIYPDRPDASFCYNGPNGYFCMGS